MLQRRFAEIGTCSPTACSSPHARVAKVSLFAGSRVILAGLARDSRVVPKVEPARMWNSCLYLDIFRDGSVQLK